MAAPKKAAPKYVPPNKLKFKTGGAIIELDHIKPISTHRKEEWYVYRYIHDPVVHPTAGSTHQGQKIPLRRDIIENILQKEIATIYEDN